MPQQTYNYPNSITHWLRSAGIIYYLSGDSGSVDDLSVFELPSEWMDVSGTRYLSAVEVHSDGSLGVRVSDDGAYDSGTGDDFTSDFEQNCQFVITHGSHELTINSLGSDSTEPYAWTPDADGAIYSNPDDSDDGATGSSAVTAFYSAVTSRTNGMRIRVSPNQGIRVSGGLSVGISVGGSIRSFKGRVSGGYEASPSFGATIRSRIVGQVQGGLAITAPVLGATIRSFKGRVNGGIVASFSLGGQIRANIPGQVQGGISVTPVVGGNVKSYKGRVSGSQDISLSLGAMIRSKIPGRVQGGILVTPTIRGNIQSFKAIEDSDFIFSISPQHAETTNALDGDTVKVFLELQDSNSLRDFLPSSKVARDLMIDSPTVFSDDSYFTESSDVSVQLDNTEGDFTDNDNYVGKQAQIWGYSNANQKRLILSGYVSSQALTVTELTLTISDIPIKAMEETLPKRTITEEEFPTSQNIGTKIPIVFGRVLRHLCPNLSIGYQSTLSSAVSSGENQITLESVIGIAIGDRLAVGLGTNQQEDKKVESVSGNTVTLTSNLSSSHSSGAVVTNYDNVYDYLLGEGEYSGDNTVNFAEVERVYHAGRALPELVSSSTGMISSGTGDRTLTIESKFARPLDKWYENFVIDFYSGNENTLEGSFLVTDYDTSNNEIAFSKDSADAISYDSYRLREYRFFDGSQSYPYPGYAFIRFAVRHTGEVRANVKGFSETNPAKFIEYLLKDANWGAGASLDSFSSVQMALEDYKIEGAITQDVRIAGLVEEVAKLFPLKVSNSRGEISLSLQEKVEANPKEIESDVTEFVDPPAINFIPLRERVGKITVKYRRDGSTGEYLTIDTEGDSAFNGLVDDGIERIIELPFVYEKATADRVLYREAKLAEVRFKRLECSVQLPSLIDSSGGLQVGEKVTYGDETLTTDTDWEIRSIEERCDVSYKLALMPFSDEARIDYYTNNVASTRDTTEERDPFDPDLDYSQVYPEPVSSLMLETSQKISSTGEESIFITASWTKPEENYSGAHVYYRETSATTESYEYAGIALEELQFQVPKPNTNYTVRVFSIDAEGVLLGTPVQATIASSQDTTAPPVPSAPELSGQLRTIDVLVPNYSRPADFDRFEYDLDPNYPGYSGSFFSSDPQISLTFEGDSTDTYRARVKAIDKTGNESDWSSWSNNHTLVNPLADDQIEERVVEILNLDDDGSSIYLEYDNEGDPVGLQLRDIDGNLINSASIPTAAIQTGAITEVLLASEVITEAKLAADAVTSTKIADDSIETPHLVAGAVQSEQIATGAVLTDKIVAGAITAAEIAAGAIETDKIAAGAIEANLIAANAIATEHIAADAVTANEADIDSLSTEIATVIELNADRITAGELGADHITGDIINTRRVFTNLVTVSTVANGLNQVEGTASVGAENVNVSNFFEYVLKVEIPSTLFSDSGWDGFIRTPNSISTSYEPVYQIPPVFEGGTPVYTLEWRISGENVQFRVRTTGTTTTRILLCCVRTLPGFMNTDIETGFSDDTDENRPSLSNPGTQNWTVGDSESVTVSVSGGESPFSYSWSGTVPPGLSFPSNSNTLSGIPTTAGTYSVTLMVTDNDNKTDSVSFSIVVVAADSMPTLPSISNQVATVGTAFSFTHSAATGGDGTLTYSASGTGNGISYSGSTLTFSGTPTSTGTLNITVTVTDADGDDDTESFTITIGAADSMPTLPSISNQVATVGTAFSFTHGAATGGDGTLTYSASGTGNGISYSGSTLTFSGTPTSTGTLNITVTVTDADGDDDTESFTITIGAADSMPTLPSISNQVATVGTAFSFTHGAATGGDGTLTYSASGTGNGISYSGSTLTFSGTPTSAGTLNITVTVTDADGDDDTESFTITISAAGLTTGSFSYMDTAATVSASQLILNGAGQGAPWSDSSLRLPEDWTASGSTGRLYLLEFRIERNTFFGTNNPTANPGQIQINLSGANGDDNLVSEVASGMTITITSGSDSVTVDGPASPSNTSVQSSSDIYEYIPSNAATAGNFAEDITTTDTVTVTISYTD